MRTLRLARIAAEAEGLRLRRNLRGMAIQAAIGAVAVVFLIGALTFVHAALWLWLRGSIGPGNAAWVMAGGDLLVAVILALLAIFRPRDAIAEEALRVREQARAQLRDALTLAAWVRPLLRLLPFVVRRLLR